MRIRWCGWQGQIPLVLRGASISRESFEFSGFRLAEFTFTDKQLQAAQTDPSAVVFQGLETDASRISQRLQDWLSTRGVTTAPGDRVIDLLRKVRSAAGLRPEDVDISSSE